MGRRNRSRLLLAGAVVAVSSGAQFLAPATYRALASAPEGLPGVLSFIATVGWPFAAGEILARNTAGLLMPLPRAAPATVALVAMVRWLCIVWRAWGFDEAALIRRRRVPVWLVIGEFPLPSPRDRVIRSARQQVGQLWLDMLRERRGRRALASTALWQVAWPFIAGACLSEGQAVQQGIYATGVRDADEALYQVFLSSLAWGFVLSMLVAVPGAWVLALTAILWTRRTARRGGRRWWRPEERESE